MARSEHIAVVGAGRMGHGIAQVFASKGHEVALTDSDEGVLAEVPDRIRSNLDLMAHRGLGSDEETESTLENIRVTPDIKETVSGARFIVEAVPEDLGLKQRLFQRIEELSSPTAVLATNTALMSIAQIAAKVKRKERVVGTRFWNPPYLIPLVEVVRGIHTSTEVTEYAFDLLRTAGKHPIKVNRDAPGAVGGRLEHALWREAVSIVDQGITDAASVDEVVKNGLAIGLSILAPLETADIVGLDITLGYHDRMLRYLNRSARPAKVLKDKVERGELGLKTGKGFYSWDGERVEQIRRLFLEGLVKWAKEHETGL